MIFYKTSGETPAWLSKPNKRDYTQFYVFCDGEALSWPRPGDDWKPLCEGVEYIIIGEFAPLQRETFVTELERVKTPCGSSVPVYPAIDRDGHTWVIPMIVDDNGATLSLTWAMVGGVIGRNPSEQQKQIIESCTAMREGFLSENEDDGVPIEMAATIAGKILAYGYHAHESEFLIHGILDDHLVPRVLMAACGLGTPEHEL